MRRSGGGGSGRHGGNKYINMKWSTGSLMLGFGCFYLVLLQILLQHPADPLPDVNIILSGSLSLSSIHGQ